MCHHDPGAQTFKVNANPVQTTTVELSPDGQTLTQTLKQVPTNEMLAVLVYETQQ